MGGCRIACAWMVLLGSVAATAEISAAPSQQAAERKLAAVHEQIRKSQHRIEKDRGEAGRLERDLRKFERRIGQLDRKLDATESSLVQNRERMRVLGSRKQDLLKRLARHQNILYAQVRSEYLYGGQERLKLLLNQQEHTKLGRTLVYYDYLHRARLHEMEQSRKVLEAVREVQAEVAEEQERGRQAQVTLLSQKRQIAGEQEKRKKVLERLRASVSDEQSRLANLEADKKQLEALLDELQAALVNIPYIDQGQDFREVKGRLAWPVAGKPSNRFGQLRNFSHRKLYWQGVFIPNRTGNDVYSIFHGRVVFAEWMRGLGLLIIIDHGHGYMSLYGHNQGLYRQPGEWVGAGERIASVGNSGGNLSTGVYFEIRKQGKPVNPGIWCKKPAQPKKSG